jgi:hypothetical protein
MLLVWGDASYLVPPLRTPYAAPRASALHPASSTSYSGRRYGLPSSTTSATQP